jgi:hypothetical protein
MKLDVYIKKTFIRVTFYVVLQYLRHKILRMVVKLIFLNYIYASLL